MRAPPRAPAIRPARRLRPDRARASPSCSSDAFAWTSRAQARARTAEAGFCLWGIEDEPPPSPSDTSPTSVSARRTTSSPTFPHAAPTASSAPASSAIGARSACHGTTGYAPAPARTRTATRAPDRASPQAHQAAPAGGRRPGAAALRRARPASPPPSARRWSAAPAGATSGRPSRVERCASASAAARRRGSVELGEHERAGIARDEHRRRVEDVLARRPGPCAPGARSRSARASGTTGLASARPSSQSATMSYALRPEDVFVDIGARHLGEHRLGLEHRRQPRLVGHRLAQRPRHVQRLEGRQCAKKTVWRSPCMRISKRNAPFSASATSVARLSSSRADQHRVGRVRLRLVREVDARELVLEQPAREHEHVETRRLARQRLGLGDHERKASLGVGAAPRPSACPRDPRARPSRRGSVPPARRRARRSGERAERSPGSASSFCGSREGRSSRTARPSARGPPECQAISSGVVAEPPAEDDVPLVAERPLRLRGLEVEACDQQRPCLRVAHGRGRSGRTPSAGRRGNTSG